MKAVAIITAAGQGQRMGQHKQFLKIAGKPMLWWTVRAFQAAEAISEIILVVNKDEIPKARKLRFSKISKVVAGGKERQVSVLNGLKATPPEAEIIAIHDGARPMISPKIINLAVAEAARCGAVIVGVPVIDTIKSVDQRRLTVSQTVDRGRLWAAQTPQVFRREIIQRAFKRNNLRNKVTDDSMLVEKIGQAVKLVAGSYRNIKITTPDDLLSAASWLKNPAD
jgi:2-C-methyl-D-erythritol 4-phosphate cytidylyltransferase